jgi:hypothetical protein
MAIDAEAAEAVVEEIVTNVANATILSLQNALKKQSAMTIPKREHHAKTVAIAGTSALASVVTEPNVASAKKTPVPIKQRLIPKMQASKGSTQTQQISVLRLALKERLAARADASAVKGAASVVSVVSVVSAETRALKMQAQLKLS